MDYIGATPQQNPIMGLLAERLKQAQQFAAKPFGYQNPPAEMLMNLLGIPAVQQTAERLAYGEPLTTGRGMTTRPRAEAVEAALTVAPVAGLLGKTAEKGMMAAGRAGERYAERVVPQIMERGGLPAQLLGDLSQGSISPMDVWHGTPHRFDRFDASKIGTGEGAQVYGQGIYTAEARPVAEEYRKALTGNQYGDKIVPTVDGKPVDTPVLRNLIRNGQSPEDFIASMQNKLESQKSALSKASKEEVLPGVSDYDMAEMALSETKKLINEAKSYIGKEIKAEQPGYLYKVDLPDEAVAQMLDWDKPLSEQPEVWNRLKESGFYPFMGSDLGRVYKPETLEQAQELVKAGVPGLKYFDEKSRTAPYQVELFTKRGKYAENSFDNLQQARDYAAESEQAGFTTKINDVGTRNFVIFPGNEDLLRILEINDKPLGLLE